jgi:predicted enzyme related to lactoylglutathione lyase
MDLNNIMIGSEDPQPLVDFYTKIFGEPGWSEGGYTGWRIGSGGLMIGPHDQVKGKNAHPGRLIWNLETDDVRGEFDRISATGATVIQEPYSPSADGAPDILLCTFADPDDNYFQLATPMPTP